MSVRLELVVLSYNGQALAAPLSRALDTPISIGRGSDNDLPLNDPERLISRHQARLSMTAVGTVDISNLSSNSSLFINGSELAPGQMRRSAAQSVAAEQGLPVVAVATLGDLLAFTAGSDTLATQRERLVAYREAYGSTD